MAIDKDTRAILKAAAKQGFTITYTKSGHPVVSKDGRRIATASGTASDHRSLKNFIADLRRAGFQWPPKQ